MSGTIRFGDNRGDCNDSPAPFSATDAWMTRTIYVVMLRLNLPDMLARSLASVAEGSLQPDKVFIIDNR